MKSMYSLPETMESQKETIIVIGLALAAAAFIKLPALFGFKLDQDAGFYLRNFSLFVLPLLTVYFAWKRQAEPGTLRWPIVAFVAAAVFANIYPFAARVPGSGTHDPGYTEMLTALHLPVALWLLVGMTYEGGRWNQVSARMDFIRFSGELFIYYVLIALGGGVLTGSMALIFQSIEIDIEPFFESWLLPCGAVGAVIIASWLVEAKQDIAGNIAPVLARLFTPLFAIVLITFLGALVWSGRGMDINREVLIVFDVLLVVVLGLLLYSISARNHEVPPGAFDVVQVVLLTSALLADAVALWAIIGRITDLGFTPNRVAALGLNIILLANLIWSGVLYIRFMRGGVPFTALERWQTNYLPVYAAWASVVVVIFPPLFGYI